MKLLTMELMSDENGSLTVPLLSLKGLESDAPFSIQICMEEEECEGDTLYVPQILLEDAGINPMDGLQVVTGEGMVIVCQSNRCDVQRIIAGGH